MVKYFETHTMEEQWFILRSVNLLSISDIIDAVEALYQEPTLKNIDLLNQVEYEESEAIEKLDEDDRRVLLNSINHGLYRAYRLNLPYYNEWLFIKQRAQDLDLKNVLNPMINLSLDIRKMIDEGVIHGDRENLYDRLDLLFDDYDTVFENLESRLESEYSIHRELFIRVVEQRNKDLLSEFDHHRNNVFAKWVSSLRIDRNLAISTVSKRSGLRLSYIQDLEKGLINAPSIVAMQRLAMVYDVPLSLIANVAYNRLQPLSEVLEHSMYLWNDEWVDDPTRTLVSELVRNVESDKIVESHQSLDYLSNLSD